MAGDSRRRSHLWTHEVGPPTRPLPTFEIPIGSRRTPLSRLELIGVHTQTHRAAGFTPLESCVSKDAVEPFVFRLRLHQT